MAAIPDLEAADANELHPSVSQASTLPPASSTSHRNPLDVGDWYADEWREVQSTIDVFDPSVPASYREIVTKRKLAWPELDILEDELPFMQDTFLSGPSCLRRWMRNAGRLVNWLDVPQSDKLYLSSTGSQRKKAVIKLREHDERPSKNVVSSLYNDSEAVIIVATNLSPVGVKYLNEEFGVASDIFESHFRAYPSIFRWNGSNDQKEFVNSNHMLERENPSRCATLSCEGDIWGFLSDFNYEADLLLDPPSSIVLYSSFQPVQQCLEMWPDLLTFQRMSYGDKYAPRFRKQIDFRVQSHMTLHVLQDESGKKTVLLLLTPWEALLRKVKEHFWHSIPALEHAHSPATSIESGYASHTRKKIAHIDGEPLLFADSCTSYKVAASENAADDAIFEQRYASLCEGLADMVKHGSGIAPKFIIPIVFIKIWPKISRVLETTLQRDRQRLDNFLHAKRYISNAPLEGPARQNSEKLCTESLDFLDSRLHGHVETVNRIKQHLETLNKVQLEEHEDLKELLSAVDSDIQALTAQLEALKQNVAAERQLSTIREQRYLIQMQLTESQKSIEQNDLIRKLTILAFIFIPVSAVTSAFGMNLSRILKDPPSTHIFVISICTVTGVSIILACLPMLLDIDEGLLWHLKELQGRYSKPGWKYSRLKARIATSTLWLYKYILTGIPRAVISLVTKAIRELELVRALGKQRRKLRKEH